MGERASGCRRGGSRGELIDFVGDGVIDWGGFFGNC